MKKSLAQELKEARIEIGVLKVNLAQEKSTVRYMIENEQRHILELGLLRKLVANYESIAQFVAKFNG